MTKVYMACLFAGLLIISCSKEEALVTSEVSYDAAVLAVSVRIANEAYEGSAEQNCGNGSHFGVANLQVNVLTQSDARSADDRTVVAAGKTGPRGSIAFQDMDLGLYTVEVTMGDVTLEKSVTIKQIERVAVIMDF